MLDSDRADLPAILAAARAEAVRFLAEVDAKPVVHNIPEIQPHGLPERGVGALAALQDFRQRYAGWVSKSTGPRYFAFVTGGATPAALAGDWLAAAYDQNAADVGTSSASQLALDALSMVRDLLALPSDFQGAFVTGATTSSLVALATARQWVGTQCDFNISADGAAALAGLQVLSGTPHSSIGKALSIIGLGRSALRPVPTLPGREAVDPGALDSALKKTRAATDLPPIVVANAGTVNTCDFDDLRALARLKERLQFWLHVDGAFGALAAASPRFRGLLAGLELADSVTVDMHKWLNVPYDGAVVLTRHLALQGEVFRNVSAYLPAEVHPTSFAYLTPENSQRLRALPTWMTLVAYGRLGYATIIERCCDLAAWLGEQIDNHPAFTLLAPVRLNGICFTLSAPDEPARAKAVSSFLQRLHAHGTTYLTPTVYQNTPAIRISITNWRTGRTDAEDVFNALVQAASSRTP